jgi:aerobic-type carbon monoxide dehydrogenase small subunit (CoxS/CutS family)
VLVIKRIHVKYLLRVDPAADRDAIQRAFDHHMSRCPVYRSIQRAIDVATELELVETEPR